MTISDAISRRSPRVFFPAVILFVALSGGAGAAESEPFLVVLGIAQDAGFPQAGCHKACCAKAWQSSHLRRYATSIAVVDPISKQRWLFECTPNFPDQLHLLESLAPLNTKSSLDGILITHAHVGHYAGLIHLGREVMGTNQLPVYAMPRMAGFIRNNGPWSQLVTLKQIELRAMKNRTTFRLNSRIKVTPIIVPHRDEFSETVGFIIAGPRHRVLFLPDIDKWEKWDIPIERELAKVDIAYLDGTFFGDGELPGRDMSKIPHPSIQESISRFKGLSPADRGKIRFIHLNHTNPALKPDSPAARIITKSGHHIAQQGEKQPL